MSRPFGVMHHSAKAAATVAVGLLATAISALPAAAQIDPKAVIATYADIARAKFEDSLITANALDQAVDALIATPTAETLAASRDAWKAARIPCQQTEVYRFGNAIVDEWEGRVNAWPLDEGLIDYVDGAYGMESDKNTLDAELSGKLDATVAAMEAIAERATGGEAYDQQIGEGNAEGNAAVQAGIDGLVDQTRSIERAVSVLKLDAIAFEGSDSLDAPDKVFQ